MKEPTVVNTVGSLAAHPYRFLGLIPGGFAKIRQHSHRESWTSDSLARELTVMFADVARIERIDDIAVPTHSAFTPSSRLQGVWYKAHTALTPSTARRV